MNIYLMTAFDFAYIFTIWVFVSGLLSILRSDV